MANATEGEPARRRFWSGPHGPYWLAALAVLLRLVYVWESSSSPFYSAPIVDAQTFVEQARSIAAGNWWGGPEPFWQPPAYPYLLALIYWIAADHFYTAVRLVQALLSGASCLLVYHLAAAGVAAVRDRAHAAPACSWIPAVAAGLYAAYGPLIYFDGELLAPALEVFLFLLLQWLALQAVRGGGGRRHAFTGLVAGLGALTRPNILLFAAPLFAWLGLRAAVRHRGWRRALASVWLPLAVPFAAVVLSVTWRNWAVGDDLVFISSNGGANLYVGNNAAYDSTVAIRPGMHWDELLLEPTRRGHHLASERSAYFAAKVWDFVAHEPAQYLALLARKTYHFWSGPELKRNQNVYYGRAHSRLLSGLLWDWGISFPFGLLAPLGLLGLAVTWRHRAPELAIPRAFVICYSASVVLFFVSARYRLPVVPVLLIQAAWFACHLGERVRSRHWRSAALLGGGAVLLTVALNLRRAQVPESDPQLYHDLGEVWLRQEKYDDSAGASARALKLDPRYASARHNLAVALFHRERWDEAYSQGQQALELRPGDADTHALLGRIRAAQGDAGAAAHHFQAALSSDADHGLAAYYYGRLLIRQGRGAEALPLLQTAAGAQAGEFWVHYELGRAWQGAGQLDSAAAHYRTCLAIEPRAEALNALGVLALLRGRPGEARDLFDRILAADPADAAALANRGYLDYRMGDLRAAAAHLERALEIAPRSLPALRALAQVAMAQGDTARARALGSRLRQVQGRSPAAPPQGPASGR